MKKTFSKLSLNQLPIWFDQQINASSALYNIGGYVHIRGAVDVDKFENSLNTLIKYSDALRLQIVEVNGEPRQVFTEHKLQSIDFFDFSENAEPEKKCLEDMQKKACIALPHDAEKLYYFALYKASNTSYYWYIKMNHLINDGFGISLMVNALTNIYANNKLPDPNLRFSDLIKNDKEYILTPSYGASKQYWKTRLENYKAVSIGLKGKNFVTKSIKSKRLSFSINPELYNQIEAYTKSIACSPFHFFLACIHSYFLKTQNIDDQIIGIPVLNRGSAKFKKTIGLFTGISPFRICCDASKNFEDLLTHIKNALRADFRHQKFPLQDILKHHLNSNASKSLFDIMLSYEKHSYPSRFNDFETESIALPHHHEKLPLSIYIREYKSDEDVTVDIDYNLSFWEKEYIQSFVSNFKNLIENILPQKNKAIKNIDFFANQYLSKASVKANTKGLNLIDSIEKQAIENPKSIALICGDITHDYATLSKKAKDIALALQEEYGVKPGDNVAVMLPRSIECITHILGILYSGASFIPMDVLLPKDRLDYILNNAHVKTLITNSDIKIGEVNVVNYKSLESQKENLTFELPKIDLQQKAYIIYTSGSTGIPKGVEISHGALNTYLHAANQSYFSNNGASFGFITAVSFDLSITAMFLPLITGKSVIIFPEMAADELLAMAINHPECEALKVTPSHIKLINTQNKISSSLNTIILGGETLNQNTVQDLYNHFDSSFKIINEYGPTETTVGCSYEIINKYKDTSGFDVSIGKPLPGYSAIITNSNDDILPIGNIGELCIGGEALAKGYCNRPELTNKAFYLTSKGDRFYRTGDLAQMDAKGKLWFYGRNDDQIKVRGYRVELPEIEKVLLQHPSIKEAVVVKNPDTASENLIAFYTCIKPLKNNALYLYLSKVLPEYMIPAQFLELSSFKLNANGKIDKKALPYNLLTIEKNVELNTKWTTTELELKHAWDAFLPQTITSPNDNFFQLGGHSLLAIRIGHFLYKKGLPKVSLKDFFDFPQFKDFHANIFGRNHRQNNIPKLPIGNAKIASAAQKRLWILQGFSTTKANYNVPSIKQLPNNVSTEKLTACLQKIINNHDVLRSSFYEHNNNIYVDTASKIDLIISTKKVRSESEFHTCIEHFIQQSFDIKQFPLFRFLHLKYKEDVFLVANFHHIITDAWSSHLFWKHLENYIVSGEILATSEISYSDYADWQYKYLQSSEAKLHQEYWLKAMADLPKKAELPLDFNRPETKTYKGEQCTINIDKRLEYKINSFCTTHQYSLFQLCNAALKILIHKLSDANDIIIGSAVSGRIHPDTQNLLGLFVNTIAFRDYIEPEKSIQTFLDDVKTSCNKALQHEAWPIEKLVDDLKLERKTDENPLFDVLLSIENQESDASKTILNNQHQLIQQAENRYKVAKFDLTFSLNQNKLSQSRIVYNIDLFKSSTIKKWSYYFAQILEEICSNPSKSIQTLELQLDTEKHLQLLNLNPLEFENVKALSASQNDIYYTCLHNKQGTALRLLAYLPIHTHIDLDKWQIALSVLSNTNEALRYKLIEHEGSAYLATQKIAHPSFTFIETDKKSFESRNIPEIFKLSQNIDIELTKHFLVKVDTNTYYALLSAHHIAIDGHSYALYFERLTQIYNTIDDCDEYPKYTSARYDSFDTQESINYWKKLLYNTQAINILSSFYKEKLLKRETLELKQFSKKEIKQWCRSIGIRPEVLFSGLYALIIKYHLNINHDFYILENKFGRKRQHLKHIDCFSHVCPTLIRHLWMDEKDDIIDYLKNIGETKKESTPYQKLSISKLNEIAGLQKLNFYFNFQKFWQLDTPNGFANEFQQEFHYMPEQLELRVKETSNSYTFQLDFDRSIIDANGWLEKMESIINQCIEGQTKFSKLQYHSKVEHIKLTDNWANGEKLKLEPRHILDHFEHFVKFSPEAILLQDEAGTLSYLEVDKLSESLTKKALTENANPKRIAIVATRNRNMLIAWLAALKCGATCVPIDASLPEKRIEFILKDSNAELYFSEKHFISNGTFVSIDYPKNGSNKNLKIKTSLDDTAYIIYTSGTTGTPKGVAIAHRSVASIASAWIQTYNFTNKKPVILQMASFSFDVCTGDFIRSISTGGKLVIASETQRYDAPSLFKTLSSNAIEFMECTPAVAIQLYDYLKQNQLKLPNLKWLIIGSDKCHLHHFIAIKNYLKPQTRVINSYGLTETTIDASSFETISNYPTHFTPIGKPLPAYRWLILNSQLQAVPIGTPGELYIGGDGVAQAYCNLPELTQEKFVKLPYSKNRFYKTGDMARWMPDANVEFIGRNDEQLKVRGLRIEAGEIEENLLLVDGIDGAAVTVFDDQILAYITCHTRLRSEDIRQAISKYLPTYMLPSGYIIVDKMPLTINGKINKKKLPNPNNTPWLGLEYAEPKAILNEVEIKVLEIWKNVLQQKNIPLHAQFFEIGGHSLKATQLCYQLQKAFEIDVPLEVAFNHSSPAAQAHWISQNSTKKESEKILSNKNKKSYPLTSTQKRLYVLHQFEEAQVAYNMPGAIEFTGAITTSSLEHAFNELINRHKILRTKFQEYDGVISQSIVSNIDFKINEHSSNRKALSQHFSEFIRTFDLSKAPLLRAETHKLNSNSLVLFIDFHHIISDAVSIQIIVSDLKDLLNQQTLKPLSINYLDYALWQENKQNFAEKSKEYWLSQFKNNIPLWEFPTDYSRPAIKEYSGKSILRKVKKSAVIGIKEHAVKHQTTPFVVMFALYTSLLHKYTGKKEFVIGCPVSGRNQEQTQHIVGPFINTLPIRIHINSNQNLNDLIEITKLKITEAISHQDYPLENLIDALNLKKDPSRNPLFETIFNFLEHSTDLQFSDKLSIKQLDLLPPTSKFDISLEGVLNEDSLNLKWEYAAHLFEEDTIKGIADIFEHLLQQLPTIGNFSIKSLPWLPPQVLKAAKTNLLTSKIHYSARPIHQIFEQEAIKNPSKTALVYNNINFSYAWLNEQANKVAHTISLSNPKPETLIALLLHRNCDLIIAILGVLKSGNAYLPIDIEMPIERRNYILNDAKIEIAFCSQNIELNENIQQLDINAILKEQNHVENLNFEVKPNQLAYVIYTSGSTGLPKGVLIEHKNVSRLFFNEKPLYNFGSNDVWTLFHASHFDFSVWEIFGALLHGGTLVIVPFEMTSDPKAFLSLIEKHSVTVLNQTPASFYQLADEMLCADLEKSSLQYVIFGGDKLSPKRLYQWHKKFSRCKLINMYGITETTVHVTYKELTSEDLEKNISNIGTTIPTLGCLVVDENLAPLPPGAPGELLVTGAGLAREYLDRPDLTQLKFIQLPAFNNQRFYRSGDLVKQLHNRELEYLGRIDFQVKIRGYRIELGEIENAISHYPMVKQVMVKAFGEDEMQYLCAFVASDNDIESADLKRFLHTKLPSYMVPNHVVVLSKFPITANGKVDREALNEAKTKRIDSRPKKVDFTETEEKLLKIWQNILPNFSDGTSLTFFEAGGHSLAVGKLINEVYKAFKINLSYKFIFTTPDLISIAKEIDNQLTTSTQKTIIKPLGEQKTYQLSSSEKRLFLLNKIEGKSIAYNIPSAFEIIGDFNSNKIEQAFNALVKKHINLKSSYHLVDKQAIKKISDDVFINLKKPSEKFASLQKAIDYFVQPFNLSEAPLMRTAVITTMANRQFLLLDFHHILLDAESVNLIINDFTDAYAGLNLKPNKLAYTDFAAWQNNELNKTQLEQQKQFWLAQFKDEIPVLNLPAEKQRPKIKSFKGNRIQLKLTETESLKIQAFCKQQAVTPFMFFLSNYALLLSKYSGQSDIVIGTPVSGRSHPETANMVGCFINTLAIRINLDRQKGFEHLLSQIKNSVINSLENQDYPFENLIDDIKLARDPSRNPLFDVMFSLHHKTETLKQESFQLKSVDYKLPLSKMDISFDVIQTNNNYALSIEYCTELFSESFIKRFALHYKTILNESIDFATKPISSINYLDKNERNIILKDFNNTAVANSVPAKNVVELFLEHVKNTPKNIAIVDNNTQYTYAEFNHKVNAIAACLKSEITDNERFVGIYLARGVDAFASILAILKLGLAYVPLDVKLPQERIKNIIKDAGIKTIWGNSGELNLKGIKFINLNSANTKKSIFLDNQVSIEQNQLAYILYTSGSTGTPKGVAIEHASISNLALWYARKYSIKQGDNLLQMANLSFDVSVEEALVPLAYGATVHILPDNIRLNKVAFANYVDSHSICLAQFVPNLLQELVANNRFMPSLKHIIVGGDALELDLKNSILNKGYHQLHNHYGPTETTVDSVFADFTDLGSSFYKRFEGKTIHQLFENAVEKYPNNTAIEFENKSISYKNLNEKANSIAHYLLEQGVLNDEVIAVFADRSIDFLVAILGILKAGAAFLPVDPINPDERINYMLENSRCKQLILDEKYTSRIRNYNGKVISSHQTLSNKTHNPELQVGNDSLAYVIYTSGSTGKPKGVQTEHRALNNLLMSHQLNFNDSISESEVALSLSTISFDASLFEIFPPLINGGKLVILQRDNVYDVNKLADIFIEKQISLSYIAPALLLPFAEKLKQKLKGKKLNFNKLIVGVEPIKDEVLAEYVKLNTDFKIVNSYGPTEAAIYCTSYNYKQGAFTGKNIPIGKPILNTQIYIVNENLQLQGIGIPGELCIAGAGLARGYINRPDLTAERFVENPFNPGTKLYRTGDLAKWLPDGNIVFIGRQDHQVKIRGYRIEMAEIEMALSKFPELTKALLVDYSYPNGEKYLCAYYTGNSILSKDDIKQHLQRVLPSYMVPAFFIQLDAFPLTSNEKIDRKALPKPNDVSKSKGKKYFATTATEKILTKIWSSILDMQDIDIHQNFFELGGNSLKIIQLHDAICTQIKSIEVSVLFDKPSIFEIAKHLDEDKNKQSTNTTKPRRVKL